VPANALTHFQDGLGWARTGLVDAAFLMNYTASPEEFEKRLAPWLDPPPKAAIIPGLSIGSHARKAADAGAADVVKQIEIGRAATGRTCIFAYTYLFDSADPGELEKQTEEQRRIKATRREIILPALRAAPSPKRQAKRDTIDTAAPITCDQMAEIGLNPRSGAK